MYDILLVCYSFGPTNIQQLTFLMASSQLFHLKAVNQDPIIKTAKNHAST